MEAIVIKAGVIVNVYPSVPRVLSLEEVKTILLFADELCVVANPSFKPDAADNFVAKSFAIFFIESLPVTSITVKMSVRNYLHL